MELHCQVEYTVQSSTLYTVQYVYVVLCERDRSCVEVMEEEWVKFFEELGSYIASVSERENTASFNESADIIFELDQTWMHLMEVIIWIVIWKV